METAALPGGKDTFSSVFEGEYQQDELTFDPQRKFTALESSRRSRGSLRRQAAAAKVRTVADAEQTSDDATLGRVAVAGKTNGGALPTFKACQRKLARTWDVLQRRMARRSAALRKHNVDDTPRLLAAAEDLPPEAWEQDIDRWPEIAKDGCRLRPISPDSVFSDNQSALQSISFMDSMSIAPVSPSQLLSIMGDGDGLKTPPYARSPLPPEPQDELEQDSLMAGTFSQLSDEEAEERRHEMLRQKARKRLHAPPPTPPPPVRDQVIGKLHYLHSCREVMGESRYGFERRRLELQSDVKGASKYTAQEAVAGKTEQDSERLARVHTMEGQETISQVLSGKRKTAHGQQGKAASMPTTSRHAHAIAAFEYGRLCQERKVTMPILGSFAVHTQEEPNPLCVDNWRLGDAPLVALAQSPWRSALACAGHCRLRGNRLTNDGVAAVLESLGTEIATVDLADNSFDARGAEVLVSFVTRGAVQLRELDVSRNRLDDRIVASLCQELLHECPSLLQLGLADVQLGAGLHSGPALGMLVQGSDSLAALNVSYNMLQGEAAFALLSGVYDNGTNKNGVLRHLDLSWNCLGQGPACNRVAQKLGQVLREGNTLLHLDISFNHLGKEHCAVLAHDITNNHTLWGLHMDGNAAVVDADGFILVLEGMGPDSCYKGAPAPPVRRRRKNNKKKKKQKPTRSKKKKGGLGQEEAWQAWVRRNMAENAALKDIDNWQTIREKQEEMETADRASYNMGILPGLWLPDELCENPGVVPTGGLQGLKTRVMPPRLQEEWLQALSYDIREELRLRWQFGTNDAVGNLGGPAPIRRCRSPPTREGTARCNSPGTSTGGYASGSRRDPGAAEMLGESLVGASCWLCNGWIEVHFRLTPGVSSSSSLATASCVCAFMSLDNFARPVMLTQAADGRFEGSRFMPPTDEPLLVVFQVDDHLEVSSDLPQQRLARVLRVALHSHGVTRERLGSHETSLEHDVSNGTLGVERAAVDCGNPAAPIVAEIQEANLVFVASLAEARMSEATACAERGAVSLLSEVPEQLQHSRAHPRRGLPDARPVDVSPPWTLASSVWALHPDLYDDKVEATMAKCFDRDWQLVVIKLSRKRSLAELESARQILQSYFPQLARLFQRLSTVNRSEKDAPGVALAVFTQALSETGLLAAHPQFSVNFFDSVFVACRHVPKDVASKATVFCKDGIVRWQFLEMIVRLAEDCRSHGAPGTAANMAEETMSQAVTRILECHYGPMAKCDEEEIRMFRKDVLVEHIDKHFQHHLKELRRTFDFFADGAGQKRGGDHTPATRGTVQAPTSPHNQRDSKSTMSRSEWQVYLHELKIIDTAFPDRFAPHAFAIGNALNPNEAVNHKHLEMSFVEFLMGLGFVLWVRAGRVGGPALEECVEAVFREHLADLHHRVLKWQDSPLLKHLRQQDSEDTQTMRNWGVSIPWLHEMQSLLTRLFRVVDDDFDGKLSLREIRNGFGRKDAQQELAKLGIEPIHIEEFYKIVDIENSGALTIVEALFGMARVKERLKNGESALRFLREVFSRFAAGITVASPRSSGGFVSGAGHCDTAVGASSGAEPPESAQVGATRQGSKSCSESLSSAAEAAELNALVPSNAAANFETHTASSSGGIDAEQTVNLAAFKAASEDTEVKKRMCQMGLAFNLMDLWDFLESEGACFDMPDTCRAVHLGAILSGFLDFRDPMRKVAKASAILRQIFADLDVDGSGNISKPEWQALLSNRQLLKKMKRTGLLDGFGKDDQAIQGTLNSLFQKVDQDSSGTLSVEEVLTGFLEHWQMVQQRSAEANTQAVVPTHRHLGSPHHDSPEREALQLPQKPVGPRPSSGVRRPHLLSPPDK